MKVLGIDPGYDRLGIAVLSGDASRPTHEHSECFTPDTKDFLERLHLCGERVAKIIAEHAPDALAIETLYFAANKTTALHVAEIRGAILYEATRANIPVVEYAPSSVKLAVTGHGASDKRGVEDMVKRLVTLPRREMIDDEYDAIAVAITHLSHARVAR
ncbi:MAG: crossover junction endodeoxyribonuclease RuvC, crossover junction endodeoxyribonuclease RuvC [Candidatus Parcubacteria bacterium]|jgi:crossover junction endodeoxyribonuclease RuvC